MQARLLIAGFGAALLLSPSVSERTKPDAIVSVTTTDYAFEAPDTVSAGLVEFHLINRGPGLHHVWLIRLDPGHGAVDVLKGFHEGRPTPAWAHDLGGPNVPAAGQPSVVLVTLTPGRYGLLCFIPDPDRVRHLMKGMVREMTVVGLVAPGTPPRPTVTVKLVDYGFVLSAPLRAGHQVVAVRNEGTQSHMLVSPARAREDAGRLSPLGGAARGSPPGADVRRHHRNGSWCVEHHRDGSEARRVCVDVLWT